MRLFGTDGIRSEVGKYPLTAENILKLAKAASIVLKKKNSISRVVINKDTRLSGYIFEPTLTAGFISMGVNVVLVGPLPTPSLTILSKSLRADFSVMITASHNPLQDNGLKFFSGTGYKITAEEERKIEDYFFNYDFDNFKIKPSNYGKAVRLKDAIGRYSEALKQNTFKNLEFSNTEKMTLEGTVNKTIIALLLLFFSASYSYSNANTSFVWMGFIIGFVLAIVTIFKKEWAPYTVPFYAIFEGLALGGISYVYASMYTGIVQQAIFLTFGIFGSLLFAYKTRIIKPTENFKLGLFAATGGIFLVYMVSFIMSFFGSGLSIMNPGNSSLISIGFSLFVVIIASLNLVLDFDFIEEASEIGAPKYMEWYGVFGLLVTLIWLYLEILRLLAKLNSRRN